MDRNLFSILTILSKFLLLKEEVQRFSPTFKINLQHKTNQRASNKNNKKSLKDGPNSKFRTTPMAVSKNNFVTSRFTDSREERQADLGITIRIHEHRAGRMEDRVYPMHGIIKTALLQQVRLYDFQPLLCAWQVPQEPCLALIICKKSVTPIVNCPQIVIPIV